MEQGVSNIGAEVDELTVREENVEPSAESDQCKIGAENASDMNESDESSNGSREEEELRDSELHDRQYAFLKKYYDELITREVFPNYYDRYGEDPAESTPPLLDYFPCECGLENECGLEIESGLEKESGTSRNTDGIREEIAMQETAQSDECSEPQIHPPREHSKLCMINRLNMYFRELVEYFIEKNTHPDLFLLDTTPVDYRVKSMREIRKITVLRLKAGLEFSLEDWEECMDDRDVEAWKQRNRIREYMFFIVNRMLEDLIGTDEDEESSDDSADESTQSQEDSGTDSDKQIYKQLKKIHDELEKDIEEDSQRCRQLIQLSVLEGIYPLVLRERKKIRARLKQNLPLYDAEQENENHGAEGHD